jgi:hypothetical protein
VGLTMGAINASVAQPATVQPPPIEKWAYDVTVLTMSPDGAWGTATDSHVNRAIHLAIKACKEMSGKQLGCGARLTTVRGGWSLGIRCGDENILAADRDLAEAELAARMREADLLYIYGRKMPPCIRVVTIDPNGLVLSTNADTSRIPHPEERAQTSGGMR